MKKQILFSILALSTQIAFSQTVTNAPDSKYQFTKVAQLDATPVENQGMSGTCWSFSSLSFFESELIRLGHKNPAELSEMYIVRKAYEAKADRFIRMDGKINFSEGGAFHDIPYVIKRYGIVPKSVYTGLTNGKTTYNHEELFSVLNSFMQTILAEVQKGHGIGTEWKTAFSAILDSYLGPDITEFTFEGKKYTPMTYANSLGLKMDDYVSVTSFSNDPFYEPCEITIPDNWAWGDSYNVPLEDLVSVAENALKNGFTLAWGADVSEKGFNFRQGIAIIPEDESTIQVRGKDNKSFNDAGAAKVSNAFLEPVKEQTITQEKRQKGYDEKMTTDDHGMHIVGLFKDQNGTRFFLVKNSWGTDNLPQGYLYVSEHYFRMKTINIYLNKDGLPKDLKMKLKL
ncbi:C1 family peptidase [Fluviicola sp.]|jgi:bleomycin hydrolase|uniref:aminopeptidase C n=1 Tax=Fluviicola sp. TaxID=1917219 RepID=UPI0028260244|nr:C1 family peptidase [Fluviicola sp.]MDR0802255.1 C1 family peptidase [Fluviicola sp.]